MDTNHNLSDQCVVVAADTQVNCSMEDDAFILNLSDASYYRLNHVGNTIFQFIQEPRRFEEIVAHVRQAYDVEPEQCRDDVRDLLGELAAQGLVDITADTRDASAVGTEE